MSFAIESLMRRQRLTVFCAFIFSFEFLSSRSKPYDCRGRARGTVSARPKYSKLCHTGVTIRSLR
jgi:hypothetical protein